MRSRFLFDQHVSGPALHVLRRQGVDVVHTAEVGLARADDPAVLDWARTAERVVITRNYRDFGPLVQALASQGVDFPGVLFLASSIRQEDVGAHVRAVTAWVAASNASGLNSVRGGFGWLR